MTDTLHTLKTPLGPLLLCASPAGLRGAWFVGQRHFPDLQPPLPAPMPLRTRFWRKPSRNWTNTLPVDVVTSTCLWT